MLVLVSTMYFLHFQFLVFPGSFLTLALPLHHLPDHHDGLKGRQYGLEMLFIKHIIDHIIPIAAKLVHLSGPFMRSAAPYLVNRVRGNSGKLLTCFAFL